MSLIKCPDCGKQISSYAEACPNCGYPLAKMQMEEKKKAHLANAPTPSCSNCIHMTTLLRWNDFTDSYVEDGPGCNAYDSSDPDIIGGARFYEISGGGVVCYKYKWEDEDIY